jgi:hypothetical protein
VLLLATEKKELRKREKKIRKWETHYGSVNKRNITKETAFVAGLKRRALLGVVRFGGPDQGANRTDALTEVVVPVTLSRNTGGVEAGGRGTGHGKDRKE